MATPQEGAGRLSGHRAGAGNRMLTPSVRGASAKGGGETESGETEQMAECPCIKLDGTFEKGIS